MVDKEVLSQRTRDYQAWVEAYAGNHRIPMEWAEKGVRKEDYVLPALRRMDKTNTYGVYFIFKSMEQGRTFRITVPKYPTGDPNYRILAHQRSRFTHYYFYIHGVYVFSYRTDTFSGRYSLGDAVEALNAYLDLVGLLRLHKLIFVCHSMGGIVVRQFLVTR